MEREARSRSPLLGRLRARRTVLITVVTECLSKVSEKLKKEAQRHILGSRRTKTCPRDCDCRVTVIFILQGLQKECWGRVQVEVGF